MARRALVMGVTGQDGAYLSQLLLKRGYEVVGGARRVQGAQSWRLKELGIARDIRTVSLDLLDEASIDKALVDAQPDEVYNLAAQSSVGSSFSQPVYTGDIDGLAVTRVLEAIRRTGRDIRFFQAGTSEMFGRPKDLPIVEESRVDPCSPYGAAKAYAHYIVRNYRETYGLFTASAILFSHESPLRGPEFVTRKISMGLAKLKMGEGPALKLGNVSVQRDWGYAGDFVEGMFAMLQQERGDDYILATGYCNALRDYVQLAGDALGMDLVWEGEGAAARGIDRRTGRVAVEVDPALFRPADIARVVGSPDKAQRKLGWTPKKSFAQLAQDMALSDLKRLKDGALV